MPVWEISSVYVDDMLGRSPLLVLVPGAVFKQNGENNRGTLLVEELGSLYSNSNIYFLFLLFFIHPETKLIHG
jgi:hypothetical protein